MARDNKKIDAKGRFFIPAKVRERLGDEVFVTNGLDKGYLSVYSNLSEVFVKQGDKVKFYILHCENLIPLPLLNS